MSVARRPGDKPVFAMTGQDSICKAARTPAARGKGLQKMLTHIGGHLCLRPTKAPRGGKTSCNGIFFDYNEDEHLPLSSSFLETFIIALLTI